MFLLMFLTDHSIMTTRNIYFFNRNLFTLLFDSDSSFSGRLAQYEAENWIKIFLDTLQ